MVTLFVVLLIGLSAGVLGGFFGVGGGVLIVPALVLLLDMPQHAAIGTSLGALLPPVGILGAWTYYAHGDVNIPYAALIAFGLLVGAYFGSVIAVHLSGLLLRKAFGVFLILIAVRLLIK